MMKTKRLLKNIGHSVKTTYYYKHREKVRTLVHPLSNEREETAKIECMGAKVVCHHSYSKYQTHFGILWIKIIANILHFIYAKVP